MFQQKAGIYDIRSVLDWPDIDYWGTPSFYFFHNGVLIDQMYGWKDDTAEKMFTDKLRHRGFVPPAGDYAKRTQ